MDVYDLLGVGCELKVEARGEVEEEASSGLYRFPTSREAFGSICLWTCSSGANAIMLSRGGCSDAEGNQRNASDSSAATAEVSTMDTVAGLVRRCFPRGCIAGSLVQELLLLA